MKTLLVCAACLLSLQLMAGEAQAQRRYFGPEGAQGKRPERLEKFRKMRLIEVLKLSEEDAVRFFAKQNAHEEKQHDLMKSRNAALDNIEDAIKGTPDAGKLEELSGKVMEIDRQVFDERQRYQNELKGFLSAEQFAKYLAFERSFGRQVRNALEELHQDGRTPPGD